MTATVRAESGTRLRYPLGDRAYRWRWGQRRLELSPTPTQWVLDALRRSVPTSVPVSASIAVRSEALDDLASTDPADRFIVASALEHDLTLITADAALLAYEPVATIPATV